MQLVCVSTCIDCNLSTLCVSPLSAVCRQAHDEDWLELGYTVVADDLNMRSYSPEMTSVYSCFRHSPQTMDDIYELLVGPLSLGSLLSEHGLTVVPSALHPGPGRCFVCFSNQASASFASRTRSVLPLLLGQGQCLNHAFSLFY